ncbi:heterokaryon incompatibility protein-domain-containing protein [Echria macrotheca]|uniref:Heterokaryon incompatibility protein-domain-containing protein n=1 Tax=Echria macrotheca TaxID=438768 RepID=A0AAJ0BLD5_9PEZI|nr:heterokaryon incompatibility protein-domain-containing protein [Echria macrotheca]
MAYSTAQCLPIQGLLNGRHRIMRGSLSARHHQAISVIVSLGVLGPAQQFTQARWMTAGHHLTQGAYFTSAALTNVDFTATSQLDKHAEPGRSEPKFSSRPPTYRYRPLERDDTRILLLYPGAAGEPLRCSLENVGSIRDYQLPYTVVSYCWTEAPGTASVDCDGHDLQITQSAYNVLRRLRHENTARRIWIDGLCIHQMDLAEKKAAVTRMQDIYSSAAEVVIWLGEATPADERFFDDYTRLKENKEPMPHKPPSHFINLLRRKWFTRKWIIQEAILAKTGAITVMCGSKAIPWDDGFAKLLLSWAMTLRMGAMSSDTENQIQQAIRTVRFIQERRADEERRRQRPKAWREPSPLFNLLLRTRFTDASNVTDYVAAVMGLSDDWNIRCGLSPAYGNPGEENSDAVKYREFVNFAKWDIHHNGYIRVLSYASGPKQHTGSLPSWVPDWTVKDIPEPFSSYSSYMNTPKRTTPCLSAAAGREYVPLGKVELDGERHLLHIRGETVDTIESLTAPAPTDLSKARIRAEYDEPTRVEVANWLVECVGTATGGIGSFEREEDFSQFAAALSFRFDVWESTIVFELAPLSSTKDELVATYLRKMTGRTFFSRPGLFESWSDSSRLAQNTPSLIWAAVEVPLRRWAVRRRFCRTLKGRMGFVPASARAGDKICLIRGHPAPYVLREQDNGLYQAVGECFFDDVMKMSLEEDVWKPTDETFVLV